MVHLTGAAFDTIHAGDLPSEGTVLSHGAGSLCKAGMHRLTDGGHQADAAVPPLWSGTRSNNPTAPLVAFTILAMVDPSGIRSGSSNNLYTVGRGMSDCSENAFLSMPIFSRYGFSFMGGRI